jgi:hypothetical protein
VNETYRTAIVFALFVNNSTPIRIVIGKIPCKFAMFLRKQVLLEHKTKIYIFIERIQNYAPKKKKEYKTNK